ncbi:MAG: hypothetical protein ACXVEV_01540 [Nocardioidaceae bacterium]
MARRLDLSRLRAFRNQAAALVAATGALVAASGLVVLSASAATAGGKQHVPVNVCQATGSDSNPYVFLTVDDDAALNGHLDHRDHPDQTWQGSGWWNGSWHVAGDGKRDYVATYVDTAGVTHDLDGVVTKAFCDAAVTGPRAVTPQVNVVDQCGTADDGFTVAADPQEYTYTTTGSPQAGQVSVTFSAQPGYTIGGDNPRVLQFSASPCPAVPTVVHPQAVSFTDPTCADPTAGISVPTVTGVAYHQTGAVSPGTHVAVTAAAASGAYVLGAGDATSWEHTYPTLQSLGCAGGGGGNPSVSPSTGGPSGNPSDIPSTGGPSDNPSDNPSTGGPSDDPSDSQSSTPSASPIVQGTEVSEPQHTRHPHHTSTATAQPEVRGTEAVLPTAVAAGLAGMPAGASSRPRTALVGQSLVAGGLLMLVSAGWLGLGRRRRGVHEV